ncbi:asparaginase [Kineococcus sp. R86509]|uniref:asparaginase n=1 Tax=Kineococcus sp. R86509 TaxID=3093851 RepID=UPI0036D3528E
MPDRSPLVVVITTGGTIASTVDGDGVSSPTLGGADLLGSAAEELGVRVRVVEALRVDSSTITLAQAWTIRTRVAEALADPAVDGVVVLHGTDSLEETGYLLDLHHDDPRPVVLTGSQRTADHPEPDAPANVAEALRLAVDARARGRGVLVAFGGRVHAAAGLAKRHTTDLDAFWAPDGALPRAVAATGTGDWPRVDVVAVSPGTDGALVDAVRGLGGRGIVLQGLGSGNATTDVVAAVARAVAAGVGVVVTTRVPIGPVASSYGAGGGGSELAAVGAVPAGRLRSGQARVLLATLLRSGSGDLAREFARRG